MPRKHYTIFSPVRFWGFTYGFVYHMTCGNCRIGHEESLRARTLIHARHRRTGARILPYRIHARARSPPAPSK